MKKIAITLGDLNGIGPSIALKEHNKIKKLCDPIYIINSSLLEQISSLLNIKIPKDFKIVELDKKLEFNIKPAKISKKSGLYSYKAFLKAIDLAKKNEVDAIATLPIHKKAWEKAGVKEIGHTEVLESVFDKKAIMMIGSSKLFCSFFTHHIPLKKVPKMIKIKRLKKFLLNFYNSIKASKIGVLALNPHAGDDGVLGDEEKKIKKAIKKANKKLNQEIFIGPLVPDTAFIPKNIKEIKHFICMYHDQGLIAIKSLFFEESINVSLNLPIIRTSVDHGVAFDIAYKDKNFSTKSYINAIKEAIKFSKAKKQIKE